MLKKLIRHEFRYYRKFMLLTLLIMGISVVLTRLSVELTDLAIERYASSRLGLLLSMSLPTLTFVAVLGCMAAFMIPQVLSAVRFYRNLSRDEGYLSFTLPVKPSHHVFCKTLVPFVWSLILIVALILFVILVSIPGYTPEPVPPEAEAEELSMATTLLTLFGTFFVVLLGFLASIVQINFSIACGQIFRKHKLLGSIGCYIALNTVLQIVPGVVIFLPLLFIPIASLSFDSYMAIFIISSAVIYLAITVILYVITCRIMTKRLNLE